MPKLYPVYQFSQIRRRDSLLAQIAPAFFGVLPFSSLKSQSVSTLQSLICMWGLDFFFMVRIFCIVACVLWFRIYKQARTPT